MTELRASDTVAAKIRSLRELLDWSRRELAERCGLSENVIENIESGRPDADGNRRRDVTVDELMAIASGFDIGPVRLMPDEAALPDSVDAELAKARRRNREAAINDLMQELGRLEQERAAVQQEAAVASAKLADLQRHIERRRSRIEAYRAERDSSGYGHGDGSYGDSSRDGSGRGSPV